jgi:hypothetical protein
MLSLAVGRDIDSQNITPERNRLTEDIIEASEYLKNWWDHGLIKQQDGDEEAL